MALLGGLAFWAVRGVAWFGLALPVALCALARPHPARPDVDRGMPVLNGVVLVALAMALVVATPPAQRVLFAQRSELAAAPVATADWLRAPPHPGPVAHFQPGGCAARGVSPTWPPAVVRRQPWSGSWRRRDAGGWRSRWATSSCTSGSR